MKVLVVGYGSMGRRRIRLLRNLVENAEVFTVDSNPARIQQAKEDGLTAFASLKEGLAVKPDVAFVCTSPGHHAAIILELLENGVHVFTELNLVSDDYDKITSLAKEKNRVVFMSSTMLYNKMIAKIQEYVRNTTKPLTYIYHIGQYLPDWHPWESYKDFFIGWKKTNGVREILAIQMPWLIETFGKIADVQVQAQRCTGLDIDFNDSIIANMRHESGHIGVFTADTVSRKATTSLEIIGEELHLFWHGHNDDLEIYDYTEKCMKSITVYEQIEHKEGYADNIIENQYTDEISDFLRAVSEGSIPKYSIEKDAYTLSVIDKIEGIEQ